MRTYIAIDLKSFYASVECIDRGLDPLTTNLVVADKSRTEKTICLAVSPSLKAYGIPGRARLFEVVQKVREVNRQRQRCAPNGRLTGKSCFSPELKADKALAVDYLVAPPRMAYYMEMSTRIYQVYLKYVAPEDMHVYSIDEVFIDATDYIKARKCTAKEFAKTIMQDVLQTTGITATAGIGTNLYLCKIAMDVGAKKIAADANGARIAELDEMTYRRTLWDHTPLTDFWRVGNSVTITANEEVTLVLTRNGETVEYKFGDAITEPAAYTLSVTDGLGNKAEMSFTVVEPLVQKFEHNFDEVFGFEKALVNGEEKRLNYGTLELFGDGTYEVGIVVSGKTYTFTVTVDATAPTLKLEGVENGGATTGGVVLSEPSETAEITVQRGEDKIEYKLGETISEEGEYGVTITDECGNSTVYTFTIEVGTNWTLIVLLVVFGLLVAGGLVFFFIRRKRTSDQDEA